MQNQKKEIINNVIVAMAQYINSEALGVLEDALADALSKVKVEEISTLPAEYHSEKDQRNQYIIQLFILKKRLMQKTKEAYLRSVKHLLTIVDKPLDQVDETDILCYLRWYERHNEKDGGKRNAAATVNNERRFLSAFFTWMRKEKMISGNPVESIEPLKATRKPIDYFRPDELSKLRDACKNDRERAIVEVLRSTGARVGELVEIKLEQIDFSTGDIMIQSEKSGRYRPIYLDDDARYYYQKYLDRRTDDSPYMFPESRAPHRQMSTAGIRSLFRGIGKRAEVCSRVYPHKMRKTLGMNLKNKGVDIGAIQEIMGHASPAVTAEYYAQSTPKTLRYIRERAAA